MLEGKLRLEYGSVRVHASESDLEHRLGHVRFLLMRRDLEAARNACKDILTLDARHPMALSQLACSYLADGQHDVAEPLLRQSLAVDATDPFTYNNLGIILHASHRYGEAVDCFTRAIELRPQFAEAYVNRSNSLKKHGDRSAAMTDIERAIALNPRHPLFHANRGNMLLDMGRLAEAVAAYDEAISLDPSAAEAHFARASVMLLQGRFAEGWDGYEWRTRLASGPARIMRPDLPQWHPGQSLNGKSILVHWEQGLGDTIQFCRYLHTLADMGARVSFSPQPSLVGLMSTLGAEIEMLADDQCGGTFDYRIGLLGCPRSCRTGLESIPSRVPYLKPDPARLSRWQRRIGSHGFKIGLCWQSQDPERSLDVKHFGAFAGLPNIRLISLQKAPAGSPAAGLLPGMGIECLGEDFDADGAFLDSAAVMSACDLVISCDTAAAHLAGALGVPAWVALKHVPDWRWLLERGDSPWYPTMRLFRQKQPGDWPGVLVQMRQALDRMLPPPSARG